VALYSLRASKVPPMFRSEALYKKVSICNVLRRKERSATITDTLLLSAQSVAVALPTGRQVRWLERRKTCLSPGKLQSSVRD